MDRNELLTATRAAFLRAYGLLLPDMLTQTADALFIKADRATSLSEQRKMLDARAAVMTREAGWKIELADGLEQLLNRSFQTAYSTFRPSFSASFASASLSLVDAGEFDGELKIDELTTRLRNAAEEQLRDLNIRMAILFGQDDINERENPFRPYLLSRSLTRALEQLHIEPELQEPLCDTIAEQLLKHVAELYAGLNELLAAHGIAAQLQLKVRQLPDPQQMRHMTNADLQADAAPRLDHGTEVDTSQANGFASGPVSQMDGSYLPPNESAPVQTGAWASARLEQWSDMMRQHALYPHEEPAYSPGQDLAAQAGRVVAGWLGSVRQIGSSIRQLLAGHMPMQQGRQVVSATLDSAISQLRHGQAEEAPLDAQGQVRNLILEQRTELTEATQDINEQMIIDVVGMLFEFILRDSQVPAEIRAQLGRLQWLVLKTALQDPALFSQKHHPARLLVNRIGSIAQGLQQLDPKAERITGEIRRIIEALLGNDDESVELFARMLDELDLFIARELRALDDAAQRASQAIENAESRTLRYARITAQTAQALAPFTLDALLQDFLINLWPYAIEHAERTDEVQALRFRIFVPELLWSIAPKIEREDRQQLLGMIPRLIGVLSEGLKLTPWSAAQQQSFKSYLIDAHRAAIAGTLSTALEVPSMAQLRAQMADYISEQAKDPQDAAPSQELEQVNPVLLDQAIAELKAEIGFMDQAAEAALASVVQGTVAANEPEELSNEALFARLRDGVPLEINLTGQLRPAQLCWMSPNETRLLLRLGDDAPPSILGVNVFKRLLKTGRARWLEQAPLFERAMESLLNTADALDRQAA
ncbi:DUF1631 family protein [Chitinibacter tainanensis]|uniref:DUF1631 family protein n=1 Tax=Chitinibacter tainanensis TaxID=230667 RepID=UPI0004222DF4|nr:DUF1631 family protein [Chitinibacter tainanensis]